MKALDTNAVVRFLIPDSPLQTERVNKMMHRTEKAGERLFISSLVILETIWVLTSVYGCRREDIIDALSNLVLLSVLHLEHHERVTELCRLGKSSTLDLADIYIGLSGKDAGCETTLTFDKKAGKSPLFTLL